MTTTLQPFPLTHDASQVSGISQDTARWTADAYRVQFGLVDIIPPAPDSQDAFLMSAWGLSRELCLFLADYSEADIRQAVNWLTVQQNALVANMLEHFAMMTRQSGEVFALEKLFVSIETDIYLSGGLRLPVVCVTNIVPHGSISHGLDKFAAILDSGEVQAYIAERRGFTFTPPYGRMH